jgi:hypothetical protein
MVPLDKLHEPISKPVTPSRSGMDGGHQKIAGPFSFSKAIPDHYQTPVASNSELGQKSLGVSNSMQDSELTTELVQYGATGTASSPLKNMKRKSRQYSEGTRALRSKEAIT